MEEVACQVLRALRAHRSQAIFSRRLGYASKVAADWEQGRRFPTGAEFLRACSVMQVDVPAAINTFHAPAAKAFTPERLAPWLRSLRGGASVQEVAERCEVSRYTAGRWLSGRTQPRLPDFLRLIDALTGRVQDLVGALVDIERVPALAERSQRADASRQVGIENPWTLAVLLAVEVGVPESQLADWLGLSDQACADCLLLLEDAGVLIRGTRGLRARGALTIDTQTHPQAGRILKQHWAQVGLERLADPRQEDLLSFNLFACSRSELMRIRALQRQFYREVRSIVAASEQDEVMGLLNLQLVTWM